MGRMEGARKERGYEVIEELAVLNR
ncbi:hypothetical protein CCACVL1_12278 [Corchorus capsularis]|uniref:Uncharacterized protein n=1 Tax=Corchorus capsularis TaxID=210143 RepID=A0A1R3IGJ6_COCAP|nr:hypothetical protein CCACVL1_12278 [Corchorus capsularis]